MIKDIAEKNHIICYDVYTGFKWIADVIRKEGGEKFIGGGEESFGYMPGAFTRDKDGVSATSLMAEIAAWVKMQNKTLYSFLKEIYAKYGFSQERMIYIVRKGLSGAQEIKAMMEEFRHNTPKEINHSPVVLKKTTSLWKQQTYKREKKRTSISRRKVTFCNSSWPMVVRFPFVLPVLNLRLNFTLKPEPR